MTTPPHVLAAVRSIPHPRQETAVPAPERESAPTAADVTTRLAEGRALDDEAAS